MIREIWGYQVVCDNCGEVADDILKAESEFSVRMAIETDEAGLDVEWCGVHEDDKAYDFCCEDCRDNWYDDPVGNITCGEIAEELFYDEEDKQC